MDFVIRLACHDLLICRFVLRYNPFNGSTGFLNVSIDAARDDSHGRIRS
jgi:hypothetical protein